MLSYFVMITIRKKLKQVLIYALACIRAALSIISRVGQILYFSVIFCAETVGSQTGLIEGHLHHCSQRK